MCRFIGVAATRLVLWWLEARGVDGCSCCVDAVFVAVLGCVSVALAWLWVCVLFENSIVCQYFFIFVLLIAAVVLVVPVFGAVFCGLL